MFVMFSVSCSWNNSPPALCASTANVVCRNTDLFKEEMFPINHILFSLVLHLVTCPYHEFKHICYNNVSILYFFSFWLQILTNEFVQLFVLPWALLCLVFVCLLFLWSCYFVTQHRAHKSTHQYIKNWIMEEEKQSKIVIHLFFVYLVSLSAVPLSVVQTICMGCYVACACHWCCLCNLPVKK